MPRLLFTKAVQLLQVIIGQGGGGFTFILDQLSCNKPYACIMQILQNMISAYNTFSTVQILYCGGSALDSIPDDVQ